MAAIWKRHQRHEDEEQGKLFVGGLSWETTQDSLLRYFSRFGEVIDCVVMKNAETGRSRGFGFVTFSDPNNIECVMHSSPHNLDGRTIDPKPCNPRSMQKPKKNANWPKVFLGGLPSSITETDLRNFFVRYGEVTEVVIMYDQEKRKSRGFGFLSFRDGTSVDRAVFEHYVNIQNKQVEIKRAEPRNNLPMDITNGPVVGQWGAPPAPENGMSIAPPETPTYSGWGDPPALIPTVPPTGNPYAIKQDYSSPPNHWGAPPPAQPSPVHHNPQQHTGWGAPPGPPAQTTYQATPVQQPAQYASPSAYVPPPQHTQPPQQHTYGTSYWGSPPGPPPPPTPVDPYAHHSPPQSPSQPKYEFTVAIHQPPSDYSSVYTPKPPQAGAPLPQAHYSSPTSPDYYGSPPTAAPAGYQIPDSALGPQRGGTYPPPPMAYVHEFQ